jgi:hypothetical protein
MTRPRSDPSDSDQPMVLLCSQGGVKIVQKAARSKYPAACVDFGPSSLAVQMARELGPTLVVLYLRGQRFQLSPSVPANNSKVGRKTATDSSSLRWATICRVIGT